MLGLLFQDLLMAINGHLMAIDGHEWPHKTKKISTSPKQQTRFFEKNVNFIFPSYLTRFKHTNVFPNGFYYANVPPIIFDQNIDWRFCCSFGLPGLHRVPKWSRIVPKQKRRACQITVLGTKMAAIFRFGNSNYLKTYVQKPTSQLTF